MKEIKWVVTENYELEYWKCQNNWHLIDFFSLSIFNVQKKIAFQNQKLFYD